MDYENKGHTDEEDDGDNDNIYDDQVVPTRPAAMDYDNKGGTNKEDDDEEDDNNYDDKVVFARPAAVDGVGVIEKTKDDDNNDDNIDDNIDDVKVVLTRPAATPMRKTGRREKGCAVATHTWGLQN